MKRLAILFLTISLLQISCSRNEKNVFGGFFIDKTLRINYIHTGNDKEESFKAKYLYDDGLWFGRTKNMINPYRLGDYYYELRDLDSDKVIYSDGMTTYFSQWQKSLEAKIVNKSFNESIRIPYPTKDARLIMYRIDSLDVMHQVWEYVIDKKAKRFVEPTPNHNNRILRLLDSGDPKKKVDIVILGDGYRADDAKAFDADATRFFKSLFQFEPYKSRKSDFNIHAIQIISDEWNTLKTSDMVFGHDRYVLTPDEWPFRELSTQSPYDYVVILINTKKNCGGSLYNNYITTAINSQSDNYIINHEIGHHIAGVADEFYLNDEALPTDSIVFSHDYVEIINKVLDLYTK